MGWEFVWPLEDHQNLSLKGHEEPAVPRSGGVRHLGSVNQSLSSKLLGIFLVALQFTTASAEGVCHAFNNLGKKFDLIGLISAFGTAAATKSLSYAALNDDPFYVTGYISPGSLSVAAALFQATGSRLAQLLALGGTGDAYQIVQLDCPDALRYVGLRSNTECPVSNAVGAGIVREHAALWEERERKEPGETMEEGRSTREPKGREAKRKVRVVSLEAARPAGEVRVQMKAGKGGTLLLGWLPCLLTIGVIVISLTCKQRFVAGLIALGTLGIMLSVVGLRLCVFKFATPRVAAGAPAGDCLIIDDKDADTFHIVVGSEETMQTLFQRKIDCDASHARPFLFLAGSMLYAYVVASVLYMPNVSVGGQILFALANFVGFVMDVVKASRNSRLGLARKAVEQFQIVPRPTVVFRNRTAAVAFVAKHARDRAMLKSKKLLPCDGPTWEKWWEVLVKCADKVDTLEHEDTQLLEILLEDMRNGLNTQ